jgi:FkbM family methyltransferase
VNQSLKAAMNIKSKIKNSYKRAIFNLSANHNTLFGIIYKFFYKPRKDSLSGFTSLFSKSLNKITVIQIGANDGINNDPIHKFIRRDSWQGVLLEPQKYVFEKYLKPLYSKSDGIVVLNAALDYNDGHKPIFKLAFSNSRWATGLTSFNRKVLEMAVDSGAVEIQAKKEGIILPEKKDDYISEEKVMCISTSSMLRQNNIEKIDWLQIDTEGFDYEIIKMFNIDETRPTVISYENMHLSEEDKKSCIDYLISKNYKIRNFEGNTLAMRNPLNQFERFFKV